MRDSDIGLAAGVPLLELLVSPAAIYASELLFLLGLSTAIRVHRRKETRLEDGISTINDEFAAEYGVHRA